MNKFKTFVLGSISCMSLNVYGGSAEPGMVSNVHFLDNGVVLFYTDGAIGNNVPSCAVAQPSRFAIDGSTDAGKAQLSGLLLAFATSKRIQIYGKNNCDVWGDTETVYYFKMVD
ncbi:hypothetical protein [Teredinibacter turnerae]|uniref:hypothetical protein n=1 Tax=Teredinibacter turnerae TaxID=2426 RepID=UPI00068691B1|nr:hypothetical protein [Teredinibacter turnerae]